MRRPDPPQLYNWEDDPETCRDFEDWHAMWRAVGKRMPVPVAIEPDLPKDTFRPVGPSVTITLDSAPAVFTQPAREYGDSVRPWIRPGGQRDPGT